MNKHLAFASLLAAITGSAGLMAADHIDSPAATAEPAADITDVYAWMTPDSSKVNLVMNTFPFAGEGANFSTAVTYAFHVNSSTAYGEPATETQILCKFYDTSKIECWAGDEYVEGDPSDTSGITSQSGGIRVFAGLRNDPFFFELTGFKETVKIVIGAASGLTFDDEGCPDVNAETSAVLVGQLQSGIDGAAASDFFAGADVLALVVQIDKSVVTSGGPLLGVWGSTHMGGN